MGKEIIVRLRQDCIKLKGGTYVRDLVRCRECKRRDDDYVCYKWASIDECPHVKPDDYCSYGEREGE